MLKETKTNETGRSMVEMLGVLAIIGVLSVAGIAGYTTAMRSYKANEIVNASSMLYMMGMGQNKGEGTGELAYSAIGTNPSGATLVYSNKTITITFTDTALCPQVKNKLGSKVTTDGCSATPCALTVTLGEIIADAIEGESSSPLEACGVTQEEAAAGWFCCGTSKAYHPEGFCCRGVFYDNASATACCNGLPYNENNQVCCGRNIYPLNETKVCENGVYKLRPFEELCEENICYSSDCPNWDEDICG